jgi:methyltransferase OMS1
MAALVRAAAAAAATSVAICGVVVGYGYALGPSIPCQRCERVTAESRNEAYERESSSFDSSVAAHEYWSGIEGIRARLIYERAEGRVLEVAAGTGRNLRYYDPKKVRELLCVEASDGMVRVCQDKLNTSAGTVVDAKVVRGDVESLSSVRTASMDTVVDTFGLCSYEDPVRALREMARVCKPQGAVLLLEHGRSSYTWLSNILDSTADAHADRWGCYWNRDIMAMVEDAGLKIVDAQKHHLGTTFVIVAKPK